MCIQADLNRCLTCQILPAVEIPCLGYRDIYGAWEPLQRRRSGLVEESGASRLSGQGCVEATAPVPAPLRTRSLTVVLGSPQASPSQTPRSRGGPYATMRMFMRHRTCGKARKSGRLPEKVPGRLSRPFHTRCWIWTRRIHLPRTRVNEAGTAVLSLHLLTLANRVVEQRPRYIDSEGA